MRWSFSVARVAGIDIRIHATFVLVLLVGAWQWGGPHAPHGAAGAAFGVLLMALLFLCVVLHELGHGLVARAFGLPVREIVLLPIGGVARLEKNPKKPLHELLIAAAGPLVNVILALLLAAVAGVAGAPLDQKTLAKGVQAEPSVGLLLVWLLMANAMLALFNLLPAFPMDGGRVLRALLATFLGFPRATRIAAAIGQGLALALGFLAILAGNFILALVALFVFMGAGQEQAEEQARSVLHTLRVGDAYNKHALTLAPGDHVSRVVDLILTSYQPDFAVLQGSRLLGVITRDDVLRSLATETVDPYVAGIMRREVFSVQADLSLDEVREQMSSAGQRVAAVYSGEAYLGLVSLEDIAEALVVSAFVTQRDARRIAEEKMP